jgi:hypothetical protein
VHLFRDTSGPHLAHFHATCEGDQAELRWEVRNAGQMHWRVLRSESEHADRADVLVGGSQTVVMDGTDTSLVDSVEEGKTYYYTVFAQDEHGDWHRQVDVKLTSHDKLSWWHQKYMPPTSPQVAAELRRESRDREMEGYVLPHMPGPLGY